MSSAPLPSAPAAFIASCTEVNGASPELRNSVNSRKDNLRGKKYHWYNFPGTSIHKTSSLKSEYLLSIYMYVDGLSASFSDITFINSSNNPYSGYLDLLD
jgi:hypothetical protein